MVQILVWKFLKSSYYKYRRIWKSTQQRDISTSENVLVITLLQVRKIYQIEQIIKRFLFKKSSSIDFWLCLTKIWMQFSVIFNIPFITTLKFWILCTIPIISTDPTINTVMKYFEILPL